MHNYSVYLFVLHYKFNLIIKIDEKTDNPYYPNDLFGFLF